MSRSSEAALVVEWLFLWWTFTAEGTLTQRQIVRQPTLEACEAERKKIIEKTEWLIYTNCFPSRAPKREKEPPAVPEGIEAGRLIMEP